jgi:hypothetical protein
LGLGLLLGFVLLSAGCRDQDRWAEPTYALPLRVGNYWLYTTTVEEQYFNGGSVQVFEPRLSVPGFTNLPNGLQGFILREEYPSGGMLFVNETYFQNRVDGVFELGYSHTAPILFFKDSEATGQPTQTDAARDAQPAAAQLTKDALRLGQFEFKGGAALRAALRTGRLADPSAKSGAAKQADYLVYDQPLLFLKNPMALGAEWTFRGGDFEVPMLKRFTRRLDIPTPTGLQNCLEVEIYYDFDRDGRWDPDVRGFQYFNNLGMVQEIYTVVNAVRINPITGREEFYNYYETSTLAGFYVQ